jgi:hypothetical protein
LARCCGGTGNLNLNFKLGHYNIFKGLAFETLGSWCKETIDFINVIGDRLIAESGDSKSKKFFLRGFPLSFNVETLQAFGALFQIPHYYRKCLHCK